MLPIKGNIFLKIRGDSDKWLLHPSTLLEVTGNVLVVELEEHGPELEVGQEILTYYHLRRVFV